MRVVRLAAWTVCSALVASAGMAQDHAPADASTPHATVEVLAEPSSAPASSPSSPPSSPRSDGVAHATRSATSRPTKAAHATRRTTARSSRRSRSAATPTVPSDGTSLSVGRHNRGRLLRGRELTESATLRFKTRHSEAHWGTDELVGLLERASRAVATRTPGARLTVGDLSRRGGGRFRPHRSHQSGRDVDLAFYFTDASGTPLDLDRFYDVRRDLTVRGHEELHYDLVRNWQLVEALVSDTEAPVQWIFVSRYLRAALLEDGARQGASADVMTRAEAILSQPSHGGTHNDQFHVRIFCPSADHPRCVDDPPIHPWISGAPATPSAAPSDVGD